MGSVARLPFLIVQLGLFRPVLDEKVGNPKQRRGNSGGTILLMVQKSGVHPLRLVVYPIIYRVFTRECWKKNGYWITYLPSSIGLISANSNS